MSRKAPKQNRSHRKAAPQQEAWWTETVEAPRTDLPDADKVARRARRLRTGIWVLLILMPVSVFGNLAALGSTSQSAAQVSASDRYRDTKAQAILAVRRWLDATPSPLPGGVLIGWDRATTQKYRPATSGSASDQPFQVETHYLTVATPSGALYTTTVPLAVDAAHGIVPLGTPTLLPQAPADDTWDAAIYPNAESAQTSDATLTAIGVWANSYTSGDPALLRTTIGDRSSTRSYVPLVGAHLDNITVIDAYVAPGNSRPPAEVPDQIVVEVTADIVWATEPVADDEEPARIGFALLIQDADTAAPQVVAWGGPGSGMTLKPYGNAVEGREFDAAALPAPEDISTGPDTGSDTASDTGSDAESATGPDLVVDSLDDDSTETSRGGSPSTKNTKESSR